MPNNFSDLKSFVNQETYSLSFLTLFYLTGPKEGENTLKGKFYKENGKLENILLSHVASNILLKPQRISSYITDTGFKYYHQLLLKSV